MLLPAKHIICQLVEVVRFVATMSIQNSYSVHVTVYKRSVPYLGTTKTDSFFVLDGTSVD